MTPDRELNCKRLKRSIHPTEMRKAEKERSNKTMEKKRRKRERYTGLQTCDQKSVECDETFSLVAL